MRIQQFSGFGELWHGSGGLTWRSDFDIVNSQLGEIQAYKIPSIEYRGSSMIIGVMKAEIHMEGITSLKGKRSIVKSVIGRLKSRFNVSVSEVDHQDQKRSAVIGIALVSNETRFIDQQFDAIINFMQRDGRFYLGQIERETFS
ncbi:MAG: DUF503 domain-containing protein [Planctomycetota bacterium]